MDQPNAPDPAAVLAALRTRLATMPADEIPPVLADRLAELEATTTEEQA